MKKLLTILLISMVFISCKKDSTTASITTPPPPPPPPPASTGIPSFNCILNNVTFTADSAWYNTGAGGINIFAVKGSGGSRQFFEINLTGSTATTYAFPLNAFTYQNNINNVATAGSLTISTYDLTNRKVSGSFSNISAGSITIPNGFFNNLPYK